MTRPQIDPETEETQLPGDPVDREIRDWELKLDNLRRAWELAVWAGWGGDEEEKC